MALPAWIRPLGLIAHELGDGDFTKAEGAPWNGIIDVLAFLPVPLVWWVL